VNERPFGEADFPALAEFLARDEERFLGRPSRTGVADVRAWIGSADLARRTVLVEDDGEIRAVGWVEAHGTVGVAVGVVGLDAQGAGLGTRILERGEAVLEEEGVKRIHQVALAADVRAPALFSAHGYREVRRFWEMAIDFDGPPVEPALPDEMRIESFDPADARSFHDALEEAFRDHWEHAPRDFDEWWAEKRAAPGFDPTLWFVVRDGDEVAAAVRNDPERNGGGWVAALGVRRAWRGRGLGKALLLHSFGEFHRRGFARASLGVDAESPTGATRLYERVGMHVELEQVVYEKVLA
jgi:ribosomal protein S18 acetylase RimI-like enzyme